MPARARRNAAEPKRGAALADPPKKTGWQVRSSVAEAVRQAVEEGAAASQNAFVERALIRELREIRRRRVYACYAEAASDRAFRQDMTEVAEAFEPTVGEGLGEARRQR